MASLILARNGQPGVPGIEDAASGLGIPQDELESALGEWLLSFSPVQPHNAPPQPATLAYHGSVVDCGSAPPYPKGASMVSRIFVERRAGFTGEADALLRELRDILGISDLTGLRLLNRYDVEGIDDELFQRCVPTVFSEPQTDVATTEMPAWDGPVFAVEYLPGQFDQRADSASECVQLISQGERPTVRSAKVYLL